MDSGWRAAGKYGYFGSRLPIRGYTYSLLTLPPAILRSMATLYMVATPIGNLQDITLRALEVLKSVDTVACEDTRHTLKLLTHFGIRKPLVACYAYEEDKGARRILGILDAGRDVAYCSDAGTPALSDPGARAAASAREAGHAVVPLPGPSAFACLLSVSGVSGKSVLFEGFLSPKPGRRKSRLAELLARGEHFVVYESPHRILKLLSDLDELDSECRVFVGREMTKAFEEYLSGTPGEIRAALEGREKTQGEFSVLVSAGKNA